MREKESLYPKYIGNINYRKTINDDFSMTFKNEEGKWQTKKELTLKQLGKEIKRHIKQLDDNYRKNLTQSKIIEFVKED